NCPPMYSGPFKGLWLYSPDCFDGFLQSELAAGNEAVSADAHRAEGLRYARHHAGEVPGVMAVRWLRTFGLYDTHFQVRFETFTEWRKARWQTLGMRMYWALLPFAAVGTAVLVRRRQRVWPLVSTFVLVSLTTALHYGNERFRIAPAPSVPTWPASTSALRSSSSSRGSCSTGRSSPRTSPGAPPPRRSRSSGVASCASIPRTGWPRPRWCTCSTPGRAAPGSR